MSSREEHRNLIIYLYLLKYLPEQRQIIITYKQTQIQHIFTVGIMRLVCLRHPHWTRHRPRHRNNQDHQYEGSRGTVTPWRRKLGYRGRAAEGKKGQEGWGTWESASNSRPSATPLPFLSLCPSLFDSHVQGTTHTRTLQTSLPCFYHW